MQNISRSREEYRCNLSRRSGKRVQLCQWVPTWLVVKGMTKQLGCGWRIFWYIWPTLSCFRLEDVPNLSSGHYSFVPEYQPKFVWNEYLLQGRYRGTVCRLINTGISLIWNLQRPTYCWSGFLSDPDLFCAEPDKRSRFWIFSNSWLQ